MLSQMPPLSKTTAFQQTARLSRLRIRWEPGFAVIHGIPCRKSFYLVSEITIEVGEGLQESFRMTAGYPGDGIRRITGSIAATGYILRGSPSRQNLSWLGCS